MPWKSEAQRRWGNSPSGHAALGDAGVKEWNRASKGKKLPARKKADGGLVGRQKSPPPKPEPFLSGYMDANPNPYRPLREQGDFGIRAGLRIPFASRADGGGLYGYPGDADDPIGRMLQRQRRDELAGEVGESLGAGIIPPELYYMQKGIRPSPYQGDANVIDPKYLGRRLPGSQWNDSYQDGGEVQRTAPFPEKPEGYEFYGPSDEPYAKMPPPAVDVPGVGYVPTSTEPFEPIVRGVKSVAEGIAHPMIELGDIAKEKGPPSMADRAAEGGMWSEEDEFRRNLFESKQHKRGANWAAETALGTMGMSLPFAQPGALGTFGGRMFSAAEKAVRESKTAKATPEQWMGELKNRGIKEEELDYLGVARFMEENAGKKITREELADHMKSNVPDIKQKIYGEHLPEYEDFRERMAVKYGRWWDRYSLNPEELREYQGLEAQRNALRANPEYGGEAQHGEYVTGRPGKNYRVMTAHIAGKAPSYEDVYKEGRKMARRWGDVDNFDNDIVMRNNYMDQAREELNQRSRFEASHYGPDTVIHMRYDKNSDIIPGEKSFSWQESQSDLHQKGQKYGYRDPEAMAAYQSRYESARERRIDLVRAMRAKYRDNPGLFSDIDYFSSGTGDRALGLQNLKDRIAYRYGNLPDRRPGANDLITMNDIERDFNDLYNAGKRAYEIEREGSKLRKSEMYPERPFKSNWEELAAKRMIKEAIDTGHEQIVWYSGKDNALRYGSRSERPVHAFRYYDDSNKLVAMDKNGHELRYFYDVDREAAERIVGKEDGHKLFAPENVEKANALGRNHVDVSLTTPRLTGSEHHYMRYDQRMPKIMEKIAKKWGAKVEKVEVEVPTSSHEREALLYRHQEGFESMPPPDVGQPRKTYVYRLKFPPKMIDEVKSIGLPMQRGGRVRAYQGGGSVEPYGEDLEGQLDVAPEVLSPIGEALRHSVYPKMSPGISVREAAAKVSAGRNRFDPLELAIGLGGSPAGHSAMFVGPYGALALRNRATTAEQLRAMDEHPVIRHHQQRGERPFLGITDPAERDQAAQNLLEYRRLAGDPRDEDIWRGAAWFRGAEGAAKKEIPDFGLRLEKVPPPRERPAVQMGENELTYHGDDFYRLQHPAGDFHTIYDIPPFVIDPHLPLTRMRGEAYTQGNQIFINENMKSPAGQKRVLSPAIHEVGHVIAGKEGWPRGAATQNMPLRREFWDAVGMDMTPERMGAVHNFERMGFDTPLTKKLYETYLRDSGEASSRNQQLRRARSLNYLKHPEATEDIGRGLQFLQETDTPVGFLTRKPIKKLRMGEGFDMAIDPRAPYTINEQGQIIPNPHYVGRARGGSTGSGLPFMQSAMRHQLVRNGMLNSKVPGRTDKLGISVPSGSYVVPADVVSGIGQGNSESGAAVMQRMFSTGPLGMPTMGTRGGGRGIPKARGVGHAARIGTTKMTKGSKTSVGDLGFADGGPTPVEMSQEESVGEPTPILAAGGEYLVHPAEVRRLGRGNLKKGHEVLDAFVLHARKEIIKQMQALKPPVKT